MSKTVLVRLCRKRPTALDVEDAEARAIRQAASRVEATVTAPLVPVGKAETAAAVIRVGVLAQTQSDPFCQNAAEDGLSWRRSRVGKGAAAQGLPEIEVAFTRPDDCLWRESTLLAADGRTAPREIFRAQATETGPARAGDRRFTRRFQEIVAAPGEHFRLDHRYVLDDETLVRHGARSALFGTPQLGGGVVEAVLGAAGSADLLYRVKAQGVVLLARPTDFTRYAPGDFVFLARPSPAANRLDPTKAAGALRVPPESGAAPRVANVVRRSRLGRFDPSGVEIGESVDAGDSVRILFESADRFLVSTALLGDLRSGSPTERFEARDEDGNVLFGVKPQAFGGLWRRGDRVRFDLVPKSEPTSTDWRIVPLRVLDLVAPGAFGRVAAAFSAPQLGPLLEAGFLWGELVDVNADPPGTPVLGERPQPGRAHVRAADRDGTRLYRDVPIHYRCDGETTELKDGPKTFAKNDSVLLLRNGVDKTVIGFTDRLKPCSGKRSSLLCFLVEKRHQLQKNLETLGLGSRRSSTVVKGGGSNYVGFDVLPKAAQCSPTFADMYARVYVEVDEDGVMTPKSEAEALATHQLDDAWSRFLWRRILTFRQGENSSSACDLRGAVPSGLNAAAPIHQKIVQLPDGLRLSLVKTSFGFAWWSQSEHGFVTFKQRGITADCDYSPGQTIVRSGGQYCCYPVKKSWNCVFHENYYVFGLAKPYTLGDDDKFCGGCDRDGAAFAWWTHFPLCDPPLGSRIDLEFIGGRSTHSDSTSEVIPPSWRPVYTLNGPDPTHAFSGQDAPAGASPMHLVREPVRVAAGEADFRFQLLPQTPGGKSRVQVRFAGGVKAGEVWPGLYWDHLASDEITAGLELEFVAGRLEKSTPLEDAAGGLGDPLGADGFSAKLEDLSGLVFIPRVARFPGDQYFDPKPESLESITLHIDDQTRDLDMTLLRRIIAQSVDGEVLDLFRPCLLTRK